MTDCGILFTMIQDIFPYEINIEYIHKTVCDGDVIFVFDEDKVLCSDNDVIRFPLYEEGLGGEYIYLFSIDNTNFFLLRKDKIEPFADFTFTDINIFRTCKPKTLAFAGLTAYHLFRWYSDNKFCGKCGELLTHDVKERALKCGKCQNLVYPKITPAIIVGVIDGDRLLMTKYSNRLHKKYALVAGFMEIGESAEEAVRREVFEEVGLKVKNIRYYKSQPWGFSGSLLLGYYADLDGEADITIDANELAEAVWMKRTEIPTEYEDFSLTNEMICEFKGNK